MGLNPRLGDSKLYTKTRLVLPLPINFCTPKTVVKISFPLNPTYESNVLKSNQSANPGSSFGLSGSLQVTTPGVGKFDVIGLSVATQSTRYGQFSSKSFDSITTQGGYQFFINAYGYDSNEIFVDKIDENTKNIPPQNKITVETVAFGFQNQTIYTPTFDRKTVDLFTPQITLARQNIPLAGHEACEAKIPDPRKDGYCHFVDLSLTVGQTFSDLSSQQNANVAVSVAPGWRIRNTDWKLTLPTTVTGRVYEDVAGGRQDALFQVGTTLAWAPPPFIDASVATSVAFSLSATYNQNFSNVSKNAWHGIVVLPTLTVAFQPSK